MTNADRPPDARGPAGNDGVKTAGEKRHSVYDSDEYYADSTRGARLTPILEWMLRVLDRRRAADVVAKTGIRTGRVLDVGAGDGKFLHFMQRLGFSVGGTTASKRSASAAQTQFGLSLDLTEGLDGQVVKGPFDLVTYWHVYEHLEQPLRHTELWPALVRPGGCIVIEVPNVRSLGARICLRSWLGSDEKHHVNPQTRVSIVETLQSIGFDPIRVDQFSGKYSYAYLWSALLGRLFGREYDFDRVLGILKAPIAALRARPLRTLNALAAALYLAPLVLVLMLYGVVTHQGEVMRIYARRRTAGT